MNDGQDHLWLPPALPLSLRHLILQYAGKDIPTYLEAADLPG